MAECRYCKAQILWRYTPPPESKPFPINATDGTRHYCGYGIRAQSPEEGIPVNLIKGLSNEDMDRVKSLVTEEVAKATEMQAGVISAISDSLGQVTSFLDKKVDSLVEKSLKNQLPQKHELVVKRPDGAEYRSEGRPHKNLGRLIDVLNCGLHVFLVGPAGGGKTTAASMAAKALGLEYSEKSMGPATSQWDLVGYLSPDGKYIPGVLTKPYSEGGLTMLDEMDNANPNVLTAINSLVANGQSNFPCGMITRHKNWLLVAAGNTYGRGADRLYVGRNQLDAATLDRFVVIDWDYDEESEYDWAGRDQMHWVAWVQKVRAAVFKHKKRIVVSPRASIFGAKLLRAGIDNGFVQEAVVWKGMSADDKALLLRETGVYA